MTIVGETIRLKEFQSNDVLFLQDRAPDTYITPLLIEGNSILSSVFVKSMDPGASLLVNYWDFTTGKDADERYNLATHDIITPSMLDPIHGLTSRVTVTRIHNKPVMEIFILGGNVRFGVFLTVVSAFASDLDSALQYEAHLADFTRDKGMPMVAYDEDDLMWHMVRTKNGRLIVDAGLQQLVMLPITHRLYGIENDLVPSNTFTTTIDYTVPVGKSFAWMAGTGTANTDTEWQVLIDGSVFIGKRNSMIVPDIAIGYTNPIELTTGQNLKVNVRSRSVWGNKNRIETWIMGREYTP